MNTLAVRPYLPLIGFVLPTVVIGYGFVIPRSCIAGVNELSVGFGTTILGAVFAYVAGQRAVAPKVCTKPPLRVRIERAINRQASSPSGVFGRLLGTIWRRQHARLNTEALGLLDVRAGSRVLEIGSGPGEALHDAATRSATGRVVGVDVSSSMVEMARARNRDGIARGTVEVRQGDGITLPIDGETFDRVLSVHCIYFWRDVRETLDQIASALAPDGQLVLALVPEGDHIPARFRDATYRFPKLAELETALRAAGFTHVSSRPAQSAPGVVLVMASRA